jgi:hypothetical protein
MGGYPTRFWIAAGAVLATFVGLVGPWVKTIFIDISGLDTDDGKLVAGLAVVAAVALVVHAKHTVREKRPLWPLITLILSGGLIAVVAIYDWSDIEGSTSDSELEGLAKVGWGLWLDAIAGVVLAAAAVALVLLRHAPYGKAPEAASSSTSAAHAPDVREGPTTPAPPDSQSD